MEEEELAEEKQERRGALEESPGGGGLLLARVRVGGEGRRGEKEWLVCFSGGRFCCCERGESTFFFW